MLKAGITSGSLSLAGDVLAQLFTQRSQGGLVGATPAWTVSGTGQRHLQALHQATRQLRSRHCV